MMATSGIVFPAASMRPLRNSAVSICFSFFIFHFFNFHLYFGSTLIILGFLASAQFFFQLGPQFGYYLSESTKTTFNWDDRNMYDRVNPVCAQDTMAVEHKFDYGIAVGAGLEYSLPHVGHFQLEARYYYGLGNIYGDTKRDYFAKSNLGSIVVKLAWLFDITKTKR